MRRWAALVLCAWMPLPLVPGCSDRGGHVRDARDGSDGSDVRDAADAELAAACAGFGLPVVQLTFSSDGRWLASAHADGAVTVLELAGTRVRRLPDVFQGGPTARMALTEDGALLVAAPTSTSRAPRVEVWRVADARLVRTLTLGREATTVVSLKLSDAPQPYLLASVAPALAPAGNVNIWRLTDGALVGLVSGSALATFTHADEAVLLLDEERSRYDVVSFQGRPIRGAALPEPLSLPAFANDGAFFAGLLPPMNGEQRLATMSVADDGFVWRSMQGGRGSRGLVFLENPSRIVHLADEVLVHDHDDGRVIASLPALADRAVVVAAPDGSALAAASATGGGVILVGSQDGAVRPVTCPAAP